MKLNLVFSGLADEAIIQMIKQDNQDAFVFVYDKYWSEMYACAFNIFSDRQTCEDLIHDVFLSLWNKRGSLEIKSIKDYLYIAVKNRSLNKIRSQKSYLEITENEQEIIPSYSFSDEKLTVKEMNLVFERGLSILPNKCREILVLSRKEHLSNKEIASRLNITTKTVENHINIALRKIKLVMGDFLTVILFFIFLGGK